MPQTLRFRPALGALLASAAIFVAATVMPGAAYARSAVAAMPAASNPAATNIVQGAVASADHTTLVAAVQAAGLAETLSGAGPFTVFAPTNSAFAKLPAGTVESLLLPAQKDALTRVLTSHVVAGNVSSAELQRMIRAGRGKAVLTTLSGAKLTARRSGRGILLIDEKGGSARITAADLVQTNGVIHVTNGVSLPG